MAHLDIIAIRQAHPLPVVAGATVKLHRAGAEFKGCCPFHSDRSPSFTIFAGGERFYCFGCGATGDVLDFVRRAHGVTLREAAAMLGSENLPAVRIAPVIKDEKPERINEARAIWRDAVSVRGTLAETYLRSRGLHLPIPESIRFTRLRYGKRGPERPCLVACVASVDNKLVGIQRTYLNDDGSGKAAVPKPKLSLGQVAGGAIRLAPAAGRLIVCEGLEDGLTLMQELGRAVWVAAGASMLPKMMFPIGVNNVAIGGDGDDVGQRAAAIAVQSFALRGLKSRAFFPLEGYKDFNDELRGLRA
ncbi:virulence-associated protein E [Sphingobium sp. GW456-12-10-14-TSB1]|nr:virulence-associated protein E [Sphingobium sp. GW456-12-10-14-TSB1]